MSLRFVFRPRFITSGGNFSVREIEDKDRDKLTLVTLHHGKLEQSINYNTWDQLTLLLTLLRIGRKTTFSKDLNLRLLIKITGVSRYFNNSRNLCL